MGWTDKWGPAKLGSVVMEANQSGNITATQSYSPYGSVSSTTGTWTTPSGFAGGYTDATGLIYLINRYYDPATGQFVSVDPLVGVTGDPYSYAGDDPSNAGDPEGLSVVGCVPAMHKNCYNTPTGAPPPLPQAPNCGCGNPYPSQATGWLGILVGGICITAIIAIDGAATPCLVATTGVTAASVATTVGQYGACAWPYALGTGIAEAGIDGIALGGGTAIGGLYGASGGATLHCCDGQGPWHRPPKSHFFQP